MFMKNYQQFNSTNMLFTKVITIANSNMTFADHSALFECYIYSSIFCSVPSSLSRLSLSLSLTVYVVFVRQHFDLATKTTTITEKIVITFPSSKEQTRRFFQQNEAWSRKIALLNKQINNNKTSLNDEIIGNRISTN